MSDEYGLFVEADFVHEEGHPYCVTAFVRVGEVMQCAVHGWSAVHFIGEPGVPIRLGDGVAAHSWYQYYFHWLVIRCVCDSE